MFNHKSKKSAILIVAAVLMVVATVLTACNGSVFRPVTLPDAATPEGNGGNAVKYGEWIYYVNGYQSSASAENTYAQIDARVGAIARIKVADIESLFAVHNDPAFTTNTARTKEIARIVAEKAEIVVPRFYYSGNTTTTQINGIYIFNDRLYIQTPNDELTAGGNAQTSQSVLASYKLDGSDEQRHYVFTSNSAQVLLTESESKVLATYIMNSEVGCIDVNAGTSIAKITEISGAQMDIAGKAIFYLDADGSICKLSAGEAEGRVIVKNEKDSHITYTISNVNNGYVYYTKANSTNSSVDGAHVFYKTEASENETTALETSAPSSNWYGYKDGIVKSFKDTVNGISLYGINILSNKGAVVKQVVNPVQNDNEITFNRIEGDVLYYTSNSIAYKVDLSKDEKPQAIGRSLASASGWSVPDIVFNDDLGFNYVITLSSGSVSAVKFNKTTRENSSSVTLTIVQPAEEE